MTEGRRGNRSRDVCGTFPGNGARLHLEGLS